MTPSSVHLTRADRERIRRAQTTLLSPMAHDDVDAWRAACIRTVQAAVGARAGMFVLPGTHAVRTFSEDYDLRAGETYPIRIEEVLPDVWPKQAALGSHTERDVWAPVLDTFYRTPYYNELRVPLGALNAGGLTTSLGGEPSRDTCAQLLTHRGPGTDLQDDRERAIYGLLHPAFTAGCAAVVDEAGVPRRLEGVLDGIDTPMLLADLGGRALHRNRALSELLARDASERIESALEIFLARIGGAVGAAPDVRWAETIRLDGARVRIRATLFESEGLGPRSHVLVVVDAPPRLPEAPGPWMRALGLTPRQAAVAVLLARGWSNKRIARELGMRPKTARRHTEAVLARLGVSSRAAVAAELLSRS